MGTLHYIVGAECTLGVIAKGTLQKMWSELKWCGKNRAAYCVQLSGAEERSEPRHSASSSESNMPDVLPSKVVHPQHKFLKLGPGLQQFTNP